MTKKRVAVAMSGGVDSSLVAARMLAEGYEVIGVTMLLFDATAATRETSASMIGDAKRVADHLNIPHYVLDFRDVFQKQIVTYFLEAYAAGITPNPCVMCNEQIKFGAMYEEARALGADFLATGHYARVQYNAERGLYELRKGADTRKDQSYVLYHLTQRTLPHVLFPLGDLHKEDTRALAKELGLPVYNKPESMDICFIPDNDYIAFLERYIPQTMIPGEIVTTAGEVLGRHRGLPAYTIGQRKGLGIAAAAPLYVVRLDSANNRLIVGTNEELFRREVCGLAASFTETEALREPRRAEGKIRYAAKPATCTVYPDGERRIRVVFDEPQRALTPGQSLVLYEGDRVLGGAVIYTKDGEEERVDGTHS